MATIADVIAAVDALRPNQYSAAVKIRWLSDCESTLHSELTQNYVSSPDMPDVFTGYNEDTDPKTVLLAPPPHDMLYRHWLLAQIDLHNRELAQYNNSSVQYNVAYQAYKNWFTRTHMPLHKADHFKL